MPMWYEATARSQRPSVSAEVRMPSFASSSRSTMAYSVS